MCLELPLVHNVFIPNSLLGGIVTLVEQTFLVCSAMLKLSPKLVGEDFHSTVTKVLSLKQHYNVVLWTLTGFILTSKRCQSQQVSEFLVTFSHLTRQRCTAE